MPSRFAIALGARPRRGRTARIRPIAPIRGHAPLWPHVRLPGTPADISARRPAGRGAGSIRRRRRSRLLPFRRFGRSCRVNGPGPEPRVYIGRHRQTPPNTSSRDRCTRSYPAALFAGISECRGRSSSPRSADRLPPGRRAARRRCPTRTRCSSRFRCRCASLRPMPRSSSPATTAPYSLLYATRRAFPTDPAQPLALQVSFVDVPTSARCRRRPRPADRAAAGARHPADHQRRRSTRTVAAILGLGRGDERADDRAADPRGRHR